MAATVRDFGGIDALVHNAGILSTRSVVAADDDEVDRLLEVNVKSPLRLTRKAWPHLLAAREGKVLVMASLAAKRVRTADASLYALSKAAVLSLAHGIRHCGAASRVRCTALCPGFVATDMAAGLPPEQLRQATRPEDIARIARTVLELPASASVAEIPVSWTVEPQY
ncbi:MAG: SDR family NAD(P)-dependent oxidoreductase [Pseudorhodoferax sp.]